MLCSNSTNYLTQLQLLVVACNQNEKKLEHDDDDDN